MIKNILAVIAGNVGWTVLWLGFNSILKMQGLLPADSTKSIDRATTLVLLLIGSVLFSVAAGFLTTAIAGGGSYWPAIVLSVIQLALGIFFQSQSWHLMPVWFHVTFLSLLVPATVLGAWLRLRWARVC